MENDTLKTKEEKTVSPSEDAKKKEEREKKKQRIAHATFKAKYFSYYDDVKTSIKEDW